MTMPSPIEKVCIIGAGAIGSLFAAHLATVAEVTVLTRRKKHAKALNQYGLSVSGKVQFDSPVYACADSDQLADCELVIIATKATEAEPAVRRIANRFPDALIMVVQNGLGCESLISRYGDWRILSAVTFMAGSRLTDTEVAYELDAPTWLAPWHEGRASRADAERVNRLLLDAGLIGEVFDNLLPAQWSKLIFNATINAVAALTDLPFSGVYMEHFDRSDLGHLVNNLIREGKAVAAALDIELYQDPWEMVVYAAEKCNNGNGHGRTPSMLADIKAHRQTEVDWINGAIVDAASKQQLPAPYNETVYQLIKAREKSWMTAALTV